MSDEWLITVAAGLLVLHGGTFLLAQMLPPASWPVPALNGAVAGVVALFWLNRFSPRLVDWITARYV